MEAPAFEAFVKIGRYLKYLHREPWQQVREAEKHWVLRKNIKWLNLDVISSSQTWSGYKAPGIHDALQNKKLFVELYGIMKY